MRHDCSRQRHLPPVHFPGLGVLCQCADRFTEALKGV